MLGVVKVILFIAMAFMLIALVVRHCGSGESSLEIKPDPSEKTEAELEEEQCEREVQFLMTALGLNHDRADSLSAFLSSVGIKEIQSITKINTDNGIAAYVVDRRGDRFFIHLNEYGELETLRNNSEHGKVIFAAYEPWNAERSNH